MQPSERNTYIYFERERGRTFSSLARELGVTATRVRQVYRRICYQQRFQTRRRVLEERIQAPYLMQVCKDIIHAAE